MGRVPYGPDTLDAFDVDQRIERAVADFPTELRPWLLGVLTAPADDRARAIGELYADGKTSALAELLIDMEEDPIGEQVRAMVATALRRAMRRV
jgi:hypothetical protein